ncbi:MAG: hypothetical protein ACE5IR_12155 [bacterium]
MKTTLRLRLINFLLVTCSLATIFLFSYCGSTSKIKISDLSHLTPDDIRLRVLRNYQKLRSFEGKARLIIELPGSGNSGFSEIFINMPDSMLVKTEAVLGIDVGALFLNRRNFGAYAPRENILYYGELEILDLRDFLEIELTTAELFEALTGLNQVLVGPGSTLGYEKGLFLIKTPTTDGVWHYWVDPKKNVVTKSQLMDRAGEVLMKKEFDRLRRNKGFYMPQIIRLTRPKARERITVYYTRQKINERIQTKYFHLKVAKNARRVYWGDIEKPKLDRRRIK